MAGPPSLGALGVLPAHRVWQETSLTGVCMWRTPEKATAARAMEIGETEKELHLTQNCTPQRSGTNQCEPHETFHLSQELA